jgi:hypothetical protein
MSSLGRTMCRTMRAVLTLLTLAAPSVAAQDSARVATPGDKSPTTARVVAIVPGAGHMYAGETGRGLAYMGGMLAVLALGTVAMAGECYGDLLGGQQTCQSSNTGDVAVAAVFALWGWSIYDAGRAAHRTNAKRRPLRVSLIVAPASWTSGRPRDRYGVKVGLSLEGARR